MKAKSGFVRAGLAPGLVCLIATPLILYVIYPPEQKDTPDAPEKARWVPPPLQSSAGEYLPQTVALLSQPSMGRVWGLIFCSGSGFPNGCLWGVSFVEGIFACSTVTPVGHRSWCV